MKNFVSLALTALMLFSLSAFAQRGSGTLIGVVRDATLELPLADAVITISSPAMQGDEILLTAEDGEYRAGNLPPGVYTVTVDLDGFRVQQMVAIQLRADTTLRVDVLMLPEALEAVELEIIGAPTVDVGSSGTSFHVDKEFARRIPIRGGGRGGATRSFESVASAAPNAQDDAFGASVSGSSSPENSYVIDGLSVNNTGFGTNGTPLSLDFIREVNVITGGYLPEYGRTTGGMFNVVTNQGSNEFHGSAWTRYQPGYLQAVPREIERENTTVQTQRSLDMLGELGFDLGGPILQDKLWFYSGAVVSRTAFNLDRKLVAVGTTGADVAGTDQRFLAEGYAVQAFGKLNYKIDATQGLSLSIFATPSFSGGNGTFGIDPAFGSPEVSNVVGSYDALANRYRAGSVDGILKHNIDLYEKRLLLETTLGWHHEINELLPSDGSFAGGTGIVETSQVIWRRGDMSITDFENVPGCEPLDDGTLPCPVFTYATGGSGFFQKQDFDSFQLRTDATYLFDLLGDHVLKFGVDGELATYGNTRGYTGKRLLRESTDGAVFLDLRAYGYTTAPDAAVYIDSVTTDVSRVTGGVYLQDSWNAFDVLTLNFGLRYDAQYLFANNGQMMLGLPNQISPRGGFIFDPTQKGRAKIYGNAARYYQNIPLDIADRAGSGEPSILGLWLSTLAGGTCDPLDPASQKTDCFDPDNQIPLGGPADPDQGWITFGSGSTAIDRNIQAPSTDEVILGGEWEAVPNVRVGANFVKRSLNVAMEDMSRDEATTYFIGNPGFGIASDFPKATRDYEAVSVYLTKSFSDHWLAQVSYTLSSLRGNYAGLFRPETLQLDPNINSDFDLQSLTINREGPLPSDRTHVFKAFGAYEIELPEQQRLMLGGGVTVGTGEPTSAFGSHPIYGSDEVFVTQRGSGPRLPLRHTMDASIGYGAKMGGYDVEASFDIFNLLNSQEVALIDERFTNSDVEPVPNGREGDFGKVRTVDGDFLPEDEVNANFGNPLAFQSPRAIRFNLKLSF